MLEKVCSKCLEKKDISEFGDKKALCKKCNAEESKRYYHKNKEKVKERQAKWRNDNRDLKRKMNRESYEKHRQYYIDYMSEYRESNEHKRAAWTAVSLAVKSKTIRVPKDCQVCGVVGSVSPHHFDYSKPLKIVWVCNTCHKQIHAFMEKGTEIFRDIYELSVKIFLNKKSRKTIDIGAGQEKMAA